MMRNGCVARWMTLVVACVLAMAAQASPEIGDVPPDLLGKTPDGEEIRISDHRGKVVVVSFWASWCPHCRKQFPALDYLQKQVDPSRMRVVVVNFKEDTSTYRAVRRQARDSVVTWTHDRSGEVSDAYGVNSVPHTFVIDKAGLVANVRNGYSDQSLEEMAAVLNELLAEPAPVDAVSAEAQPVGIGETPSRQPSASVPSGSGLP